MSRELDLNEIKALLKPQLSYKPTDLLSLSKHCKHYDKEMRCAARGCGSPTYYRFSGIAYCTVHGLRYLTLQLEKYDPTKSAEQDLSTHEVNT